jgi:hypothetical protein
VSLIERGVLFRKANRAFKLSGLNCFHGTTWISLQNESSIEDVDGTSVWSEKLSNVIL